MKILFVWGLKKQFGKHERSQGNILQFVLAE